MLDVGHAGFARVFTRCPRAGPTPRMSRSAKFRILRTGCVVVIRFEILIFACPSRSFEMVLDNCNSSRKGKCKI